MKLLIITQSVDKNNTVLGFFHEWIRALAERFESVVVICLEKGEYDLPSNVKVLSLGKEEGQSKIKYIWRFYKYILRERKNYDSVFVHMNQEYILLGWKTWLLLGKPIYMWRNHHSGNFLTGIAALFCRKVFCTSKFSYTAKYKKTVFMPIGVDGERFKIKDLGFRNKNSILFLGRIAPVKRPDLLIEALGDLRERNTEFTASIYGDALPKDASYLDSLKSRTKELSLENKISFHKGIPNTETPSVYAAHEIFVNLSSSGMYDKTIIEAMASGCLVLASNDNLRGEIDDMFIFKEGDSQELGVKIQNLLSLSADDKDRAKTSLRAFAEKHSLKALCDKLSVEIS